MLVCRQVVFLVPSPTPFPPVFPPEIEFTSSNFPPSYKTDSYAGYKLKGIISFQISTIYTRYLFRLSQWFSLFKTEQEALLKQESFIKSSVHAT